MRLVQALVFACLAPAMAAAQQLGNADLQGRYHAFEILIRAAPTGFATTAADLAGVMTFDGAGGYSFEGESGSGAEAAAAFSFSGQYLVAANGFVAFTNPLAPELTINGRLGAEGHVLLGASTEALDGTQDFFVAFRAPDGSVDAAALNGLYTGASLWLPDGLDAEIRTAIVFAEANGQGGFNRFEINGHAADLNEEPLEETLTASYALETTGSGTLNSPGSDLLPAARRVFISHDGAYLAGFSQAAGARDLFLAVRNPSEPVNAAAFAGDFWILDLITDRADLSYESAVGGLRSDGQGAVSLAQRVSNTRGKLDFSGINFYALAADGSGFLRGFAEDGVTNFAIGGPASPSGAFVGASVFQSRPAFGEHGLSFGVRVPDFPAGEGPNVSQIGVLNSASFAPATNPIAAGTLLSLFGSNLAPETVIAQQAPLPTELAGVSVTIGGQPAPLFFVSPTQINLQAPFGLQGDFVQVRVLSGGAQSNLVQVPAATTSPGVFSVEQTGIGPGVITDPNFQLINAQNPAAPGDVVIVFMTGLGAVEPPVPDGVPGPADPLSVVTDPNLRVDLGQRAGEILFAGAAPGFIGLYQVNLRISQDAPIGDIVPVAVVTSEAFTDFVDIAIQPLN